MADSDQETFDGFSDIEESSEKRIVVEESNIFVSSVHTSDLSDFSDQSDDENDDPEDLVWTHEASPVVVKDFSGHPGPSHHLDPDTSHPVDYFLLLFGEDSIDLISLKRQIDMLIRSKKQPTSKIPTGRNCLLMEVRPELFSQ